MAKEVTLNDIMEFLRKYMVTKDDLRNYFSDSKIKLKAEIEEKKIQIPLRQNNK